MAIVVDESKDSKGTAAGLLKFGLELRRSRKDVGGMGLEFDVEIWECREGSF